MNRIKVLDGWRGIAILLVLFDHVQDSLLGHYIRPWTRTGVHGVTIFFVLSGYLITSKLLQEQIDRGISLKAFYIRRFFRLMPAAWLFLGTLYLLAKLTHTRITSIPEVLSCIFFARNFAQVSGGAAGHFWSLSIEEQFYMIWPAVLIWLGWKSARWFAVALALGCAFYRTVVWSSVSRFPEDRWTQFHADALLIGCLLALLLTDKKTAPIVSTIVRKGQFLAWPALIACIGWFHDLIPLTESAVIAVLIGAAVLDSNSWASRVLSIQPLPWIGVISYSLYLWQALFMPFRNPLAMAIGIPLFSLASYYFVESRFNRFGHRIASRYKSLRPIPTFPARTIESPQPEG